MESLFYALSEWEQNGEFMLDISVYSPGDSEHWFRYLTLSPMTLRTSAPWVDARSQRRSMAAFHTVGLMAAKRNLSGTTTPTKPSSRILPTTAP